MTLAGTRPPLIGEVSEYELHHRARLAIKPGITGMWQVSGRSDITDFEEVVEAVQNMIKKLNIKVFARNTFQRLRKADLSDQDDLQQRSKSTAKKSSGRLPAGCLSPEQF